MESSKIQKNSKDVYPEWIFIYLFPVYLDGE